MSILPEGFTLDQPQSVSQSPRQGLPEGFTLDSAPTGTPLSETPIEDLQEVGGSPELNDMTKLSTWKSALALNLMTDPKELGKTLKEFNPGAEVTTGIDGNLRINLPSGEYALNKPGLSFADVAQFGTRLALFGKTPIRQGFSPGTIAKTAGEAGAIETGLQGVESALGGEFNAADPAFAAGGAVVGQAIPVGFQNLFKGVQNKLARKVLKENAPTTDTLRSAARSIYDQIDDLGVKIKPTAYKQMVAGLGKQMRKEGLRAELTPDAHKLLAVLEKESVENLTVGQTETLRKIAMGVATKVDRTEANLGRIAVGALDDFIENIEGNLINPKNVKINGAPVSGALKEARNLWGRAKRSDIVQEAVEIASTRRSGSDLGLRNEFATLHRKIIKGRLKGFTPEETAAIKKVSTGGSIQNMAFQLGRLGIPEDQASNALMLTLVGGLGGGVGFAAGGIPGGVAGVGGAIAIPSIFRRAASKMTNNNAQLADDIIKSADDGLKIVRAYLKHTPKNKRNSAEITALLLNSGAKPEAFKETGNFLVDNAVWGLKNTLAIEAKNIKPQDQIEASPGATSSTPTNF